jgi:hypothetical protein
MNSAWFWGPPSMGQSKFAWCARVVTRALVKGIFSFSRNESGNIATVVALVLVPLGGMLAVAGEVSGWWAIQRSEQHAADSAAIAAVSNNDPSTVQYEAKKVAATMNFAGDANTSISVSMVVQGICPAGLNPCYRVTISKSVPLYLVQLVGYHGTNGTGRQTIFASALAGSRFLTEPLCLVALAKTGTAITIHGGSNVDMSNCAIGTLSTSSNPIQCTGNNWDGFPTGVAPIGASCGTVPSLDGSGIADNYKTLGAANIPPGGCSSFPLHTWGSAPTSYGPICGDVMLTSDVTLTTSGTIYIYNGQLNLNGRTLSTANGVNVTIVFDAVGGTGYNKAPFADTSGALNIQAPSSGSWSGIALYQYGLSSVVSQTFNGSNSVQWGITGLIYLPKVDLLFNGAVDKSTYGVACTILVVNTFQINGSDKLTLNKTPNACPVAGLNNPPVVPAGRRVLLAG